MKIMIDGVIREMTAEEEREFYEAREGLPDVHPDEQSSNKAEAYDVLMGVIE